MRATSFTSRKLRLRGGQQHQSQMNAKFDGFGHGATLLCLECGEVFHVSCAQWIFTGSTPQAKPLNETILAAHLKRLKSRGRDAVGLPLRADDAKLHAADHKRGKGKMYWIFPPSFKISKLADLTSAANAAGIRLVPTKNITVKKSTLEERISSPVEDLTVSGWEKSLEEFLESHVQPEVIPDWRRPTATQRGSDYLTKEELAKFASFNGAQLDRFQGTWQNTDAH